MRDELKQEWRRLAPVWVDYVRDRCPEREGLLDGSMLAACGDVTGLRILDSGCGEGRFSRMLVEQGASSVLGLDLCELMIQAARELRSGPDEYDVADVQDLEFLDDETFDLAVSYLNQCDLPDFFSNTREVFRALKPCGRFIVANVHPMRSAGGPWQKTATGEKEHIMLDRYFEEGERQWEWKELPFTNFHRSLSTYTSEFIETGFAIEEIVEPAPTEEQVAEYPEIDDELRVPNFILFVLKKPARGKK